MGSHWGYIGSIGVMLGLYWGHIRVILGLYRFRVKFVGFLRFEAYVGRRVLPSAGYLFDTEV